MRLCPTDGPPSQIIAEVQRMQRSSEVDPMMQAALTAGHSEAVVFQVWEQGQGALDQGFFFLKVGPGVGGTPGCVRAKHLWLKWPQIA